MAVEYKDYYKILGVSRDAGKDEIAKAYKKLARKHHPDLNANDKQAEERFKEVNEAHEVLKDPKKRQMYDTLGPNWQNGQNFQRPPGFENMQFTFGGGQDGYSDFFSTLFGGGGFSQGRTFNGANFGGANFGNFTPRPQQGRDVEATLNLTLENALAGGKRSITVGGKTLEVAIPAGIKHDAKIRLKGQGDPAPNNGKAGDLFLKIAILPHADFTLDDADILYKLTLAPWEGALGCTARVPAPGGALDVTIAPGSSSGKKLRLRGKGLGSGQTRGDLIIRLSIAVPETLTDEERELWERLRDTSTFAPRG